MLDVNSRSVSLRDLMRQAPRRLLCMALNATAASLYARIAAAQTFCIPAVPAGGDSPEWFSSTKGVDDYGWSGALRNSTGTSDVAEVRVLEGTDIFGGNGIDGYLMFSFQVRNDPGAVGPGDTVYLGISDG